MIAFILYFLGGYLMLYILTTHKFNNDSTVESRLITTIICTVFWPIVAIIAIGMGVFQFLLTGKFS